MRKKSKTIENRNHSSIVHWLVGGIAGIFLGLVVSMDFIFRLDSPTPEVYQSFFYICTMIVAISIFFGGILGVVIGKILYFSKRIYLPENK